MYKVKLNIGGIIPSIIFLAAILHSNVLASTPTPNIPPDFFLVSKSTGVALYQNDNSDFVQSVDLGQGASIKFLYGNIIAPGLGQGVYGGNNPKISRQTIQQVWNEFSSTNSNAFCVTNGQFFVDHDDQSIPTPLAFPLKKDGVIISDGYGIDEYQNPNQKLMLELWDNRADIIQLTQESLISSSAPNILAGLSESANKSQNSSTGRTFAGINDNDGDGYYDRVLIFNSKTATQAHATGVLRSFGADKVIMFDGGGSTQLFCQDTRYIASSRWIPQTIVVASSKILPTVPFWDNIQQHISEWWENQNAALSDWWDEQQKLIGEWWEKLLSEQEQNLKNWLNEMERDLVKLAETQLEQLITQLCGCVMVPGGLVVTIWGISKKLRKA